MYLKIKEMKDSKLVLDLTNGCYTIGIQVPGLKVGNIDYIPTHTELIEEYDAMDYRIEEMVDRLNTIYGVLTGIDSKSPF